MSIAIFGGSGFIGTRLASLLSSESFKIFDKRASKIFPKNVRLCDVRQSDTFASDLSGADVVVLLAAEHRDDVTPTSLYYEVNFEGARNVVEEMRKKDVRRLIFTSTVAVYGLNSQCPDERSHVNPLGHYGQSKWNAEGVLRTWWQESPDERELIIVRPCVVFGEGNRGNVYNLLRQLNSRYFLMIGSGSNLKSMAYVGNFAAFLKHLIDNPLTGYHLYNYIDEPDFKMNELVPMVRSMLGKSNSLYPLTKKRDRGILHIPYWLGILGGYGFDIITKLSNHKFPISSIRVEKFCASTQITANKLKETKFVRPYTLEEGLERTLKHDFSSNFS